MDESRDCHTKLNKSDREGEISWGIHYIWNLKRNVTSELTKQKDTHRLRIWTYNCQGEEWGEG